MKESNKKLLSLFRFCVIKDYIEDVLQRNNIFIARHRNLLRCTQMKYFRGQQVSEKTYLYENVRQMSKCFCCTTLPTVSWSVGITYSTCRTYKNVVRREGMEPVYWASSRVTVLASSPDFQHPPHLQFLFSLETFSVTLALRAAALVCDLIMPAGSKKQSVTMFSRLLCSAKPRGSSDSRV